MATQDYQTPQNSKSQSKSSMATQNAQNRESLLSPRFRTAAAMAGWDEEALILATLVVEDTPERDSKQKKRSHLQVNIISPADSTIKRRAKRRRADLGPMEAICLDDSEEPIQDRKATKDVKIEETKKENEESLDKVRIDSNSAPALPCIDRLREELSCAICLEICFEPSTTSCGHSFCMKCLKSAADKCGKKCPKCRQLIGNARSCSVNTVLWNTIQLLFPQEIEARKSGSASHGSKCESPNDDGSRRQSGVVNSVSSLGSSGSRGRRRRRVPTQTEDAALALRLQREEFMEAFRGTQDFEQRISTFTSARARLAAMASRAAQLRIRRQPL